MSDDVSGYCDRHEIHANEFIEAEYIVRIPSSGVWKLCSDCKDALHNWFANFPTAHDHVARRAHTNGEIIEKRLEEENE